jgi:hypothetical protein
MHLISLISEQNEIHRNGFIGIYLCLSLMMSVTRRVVDLAVTAVIKLA